ncbi:MAG: hypothetical protein LBI06_00785 [Treponema sp.]|jgi:hypothetical protein|nr:hypothetical protein [Treponema sp.]
MVVRFPLLLVMAFLVFLPANSSAQVLSLTSPEIEGSQGIARNGRGGFFPGLYFTDVVNTVRTAEDSSPYWVRSQTEEEAFNRVVADHTSMLLNNDILAFYGHPRSQMMGILGRYSIEELDKRLTALAREYEAESGGRNIIKAFYIIFGTVWPEGEIGIIGEELLKRYIEYGLQNDILVFIDHQIGRYDPINSLRRMLPWLQYPNVHLALDPEWRTTKPMQEIGYLTAEEVNTAQQVMEEYIIANNIPGERFLVIHQFNWRMIRNRERVRSDFHRVRLVHCADGFGSPRLKRASYAYNAEVTNIPIKAFKLFYNFNIPGAGYDNPLMTPRDVYALTPRPYIIMYQ